MVGGSYLPPSGAEDYELGFDDSDDAHAVQWVGTPGVKGPKWGRLPLLTVGVLGTQVVWSIEMGYASPYLLELGLSKSWMSLVFVAGPLSGLIVQPLIGAYADRSRSRFGRRRPFMLAGTGIAAVAMMLLAWSREIAGFFGLGNWAAITVAVFAIYLIDFSINAVMSTDRALIVDTLPPSQQEAANAWAGRMAGIGGVSGFFVGNVDLTGVFKWIGKTQLQILSFMTSFLLILAHTSTSWAVTERVLLRDNRQQSRSGLLSSLKSIWQNMFTLPRSIRSICFIQFFANLGWYPVLFFTSIWVSEIYKQRNPQGDLDKVAWDADAVRAGSRALFLQSAVALSVSIAAPFLVEDSGVQSGGAERPYTALGAGDDHETPPNSARWKREEEEDRDRQRFTERAAATLAIAIKAVRSGSAWALPVRGLTLIRLWFMAQCLFALCMLATWPTSTVGGAYFVIGTTGFAWSLAQWAPFALIGELVLIDTGETEMNQLRGARPSEVVFASDSGDTPHLRSRHSRNPSHETLHDDRPHGLSRLDISDPIPTRSEDDPNETIDLDTTVILRHSDETAASIESFSAPPTPATPATAASPNTADKAGLILGIHNVFIVLPQFVITAVSSLVFFLMEPTTTTPPVLAPNVPAGVVNGSIAADAVAAATAVIRAETEAAKTSSPDAVGLIFRIGGTSAAIGAYLSYRLMKRWQAGHV